jgi:hypothetical protein
VPSVAATPIYYHRLAYSRKAFKDVPPFHLLQSLHDVYIEIRGFLLAHSREASNIHNRSFCRRLPSTMFHFSIPFNDSAISILIYKAYYLYIPEKPSVYKSRRRSEVPMQRRIRQEHGCATSQYFLSAMDQLQQSTAATTALVSLRKQDRVRIG